MKLLIIESQGKVEKLQSILGDGWKVSASLGHVCDLPDKEIGVKAPKYKPQYRLSERCASVVSRLRSQCERASEILIGTDPDREGEAIAWHLARELKRGRDAKRVRFPAITETVVRQAVAAPTGIDYKLVGAQEARRVLDRLVGYLVSPALSKIGGTTLSAGRVQSPAVALVVMREREISAFTPTNHFQVRLDFQALGNFADAKNWHAMWEVVPDFAPEDRPYFQDAEFAARVAAVESVMVEGCEDGQRRRAPAPPLATSGMQQAASVKLGFDPEDTMRIAQRLFESGHITYHRTDNPNISADDFPYISALAQAHGWAMAPKLRLFKTSATAQAGHPAITPTHWEVETAGQGGDEQALYKLIRQRAIASQLADAVYKTRTATLLGQVDSRQVRFRAKGETLQEPGWLSLVGEGHEEADGQDRPEGQGAESNQVPPLDAGQRLQPLGGEVLALKTRAPKRYTKASLIGKLESEGIGRPATYAAIMGNIERRGYITTRKLFLHPTETAFFIVDQLTKAFSFIAVDFTREVESELDRIASGQGSYLATVEATHDKLRQELASLETSGSAPRHPCPDCGSAMRRIPGKTGNFWGCSGYPACNATRPDKDGQPGEKETPSDSGHSCPLCSKPLIRRTKRGKDGYDFWGCSGFKDGCRANFPNKRNKPDFNGDKGGGGKKQA